MVERDARAMITVFVSHAFERGMELELPDAAAHHVRVRRAQAGEPIRIVDGQGSVVAASLTAVGKRSVRATVAEIAHVPRPTELIAVVPVADRDRMLWAAEKCVELQVTRWQPVMYERSRSVSPRGDGEKFASKVRARMQSALEQSGGAWLPDVNAEVDAADAWNIQAGSRLVLDRSGSPVRTTNPGSVAFAVGPEGGFEENEIEDALRHGWSSVSLSHATLRFETAIVAAAAVIRAAQL